MSLPHENILAYKLLNDGSILKIPNEDLLTYFINVNIISVYFYKEKRLYIWKGENVPRNLQNHIPIIEEQISQLNLNISILRHFTIEGVKEETIEFLDLLKINQEDFKKQLEDWDNFRERMLASIEILQNEIEEHYINKEFREIQMKAKNIIDIAEKIQENDIIIEQEKKIKQIKEKLAEEEVEPMIEEEVEPLKEEEVEPLKEEEVEPLKEEEVEPLKEEEVEPLKEEEVEPLKEEEVEPLKEEEVEPLKEEEVEPLKEEEVEPLKEEEVEPLKEEEVEPLKEEEVEPLKEEEVEPLKEEEVEPLKEEEVEPLKEEEVEPLKEEEVEPLKEEEVEPLKEEEVEPLKEEEVEPLKEEEVEPLKEEEDEIIENEKIADEIYINELESEDYNQLLRHANLIESRSPNETKQILKKCIAIITQDRGKFIENNPKRMKDEAILENRTKN